MLNATRIKTDQVIRTHGKSEQTQGHTEATGGRARAGRGGAGGRGPGGQGPGAGGRRPEAGGRGPAAGGRAGPGGDEARGGEAGDEAGETGAVTEDSSSEMVVACCRFLCYFCRTSRQNQKAMFDHLSYLLENSSVGLGKHKHTMIQGRI